jgi:acyl dehydratase
MSEPKRTIQPARGKTFDELEPGQEFVSLGRTVTEADIVTFAGLSGDYNPLHVDAVAAAATPFRQRVAHGMLVQSIASGMAWQTGIFTGTIVALREMIVRFESPVRAHDTLHIELEVLAKDPEPSPRRGWVRFATRVKNQDGVTVLDGEWLTLFARDGAARRVASQERSG